MKYKNTKLNMKLNMKYKNRHKYFLLSLCLFIGNSCATTYENPNIKLTPESEYFSLVETNTKKTQIYNGFMNTLDLSATLMTSSLTYHQVDQNARIYQWQELDYKKELLKADNNIKQVTEIFLSFYVPDKDHDDLNKEKSKWKIFLDSDGKRFEGKVVKIKSILVEVQSLYPFHNRWSTAYRVSFPVPTSVVEKGNTKLTLTGPVGAAFVEFAPVSIAH